VLLFSEAQAEWHAVPRWIEYLIHLGYVWPRDISERRRIALISMPCDSAAAGLVSLGALVRELRIFLESVVKKPIQLIDHKRRPGFFWCLSRPESID
jgi:hypothetical protein